MRAEQPVGDGPQPECVGRLDQYDVGAGDLVTQQLCGGGSVGDRARASAPGADGGGTVGVRRAGPDDDELVDARACEPRTDLAMQVAGLRAQLAHLAEDGPTAAAPGDGRQRVDRGPG